MAVDVLGIFSPKLVTQSGVQVAYLATLHSLYFFKPPWLVERPPSSEPANQRFGLIHLLRRDLPGRLGRDR